MPSTAHQAGDSHVAAHITHKHKGDTSGFGQLAERAAIHAFSGAPDKAMMTLAAHGLAQMDHHDDDVDDLVRGFIRAVAAGQHEHAAALFSDILTLKVYRALAVIASEAEQERDEGEDE